LGRQEFLPAFFNDAFASRTRLRPGRMNLASRLFGRTRGARVSGNADAASPGAANDLTVPRSVDALREALAGAGRDAILLAAPDGNAIPAKPAARHARALTLAAWRRFREALSLYRNLTQAPDASTALLLDAAWCAHSAGSGDEALALVDRALAIGADVESAHFARGVIRNACNAPAGARADLAQVASRAPDHPDVWLNLADAERALGNEAAAEDAARQAVARSPRSAATWHVLGRALWGQRKYDEAFAAYAQARDLEIETGEDARTIAAQVVALYEVGQYGAAIRLSEAVLPDEPDALANTGYALALLTTGAYQAGWDQYDFRWYDEPMRAYRTRYACPYWTGQALQGKTILIGGEQGIGDAVQFARYATSLAELGARVMLHVRTGMGRLAPWFRDVAEVAETPAVPTGFDCYVSLMTLPRVFGTTVGSIPATVPYLTVEPEMAAKWRGRIADDGLSVGLVWAGNPKHPQDARRSLPLHLLEPLWGLPGVRFYSLQKEIREADLAHVPPNEVMAPLGPELLDLTDAAAVIDRLDLVIAVDTALAHIAGALGKPVWLLLPELPDFRWMLDREDTPWYPTMHLFRDDGTGWAPVVARVADRLARIAAGERSLLAGPPPSPIAPPAPGNSARVPRVGEMRDGIMQFLPDRDDEARSLARYGEYLVGELDLIAQLLPIDGWVLEVGSGVGSHALWLARMLGERGELFVYESHPSAARVLRQNLEANRLLDAVTLPRGGLAGDADPSASRSGPLHTIDHLRLDRLDLLKIRSAGAETILEGASATLWQRRPRVLVAVEEGAVRADLVAQLRAHGYRVWRVETPLYRAGNFNAWPTDVFDGRVATALLGVPEEVDGGTYLANLAEFE